MAEEKAGKQNKLLIPNSTQIPNVILDKILPRIPEAESKCLLYICRRTYGFQKVRDRISLTQFVSGIKNRDNEVLDYGTGLSRPVIVEALRHLTLAGIITTIKDTLGNSYELNCELFVDKYVENGVVNKVNQLKKLTRSSKQNKPKQVKLFNPQNKGNKEKHSIIIKSFKNENNETKIISAELRKVDEGRKSLVSKFAFKS